MRKWNIQSHKVNKWSIYVLNMGLSESMGHIFSLQPSSFCYHPPFPIILLFWPCFLNFEHWWRNSQGLLDFCSVKITPETSSFQPVCKGLRNHHSHSHMHKKRADLKINKSYIHQKIEGTGETIASKIGGTGRQIQGITTYQSRYLHRNQYLDRKT